MVKCPCPASTWSQGCHNFRAVDIGWCRFHLAPVYSNQQIFSTFGCVHQWMGIAPQNGWFMKFMIKTIKKPIDMDDLGSPNIFFANLHLTRTIFQAIAFGADCIALQPFIKFSIFPYLSIHVWLHPTKLIYRYLDRTSNLRKNVNGIWMECEWLKDMKGIWSQIFYAMPRLSRLRQSISGSALVRRMQIDNQVPCRASILGIKQLNAYSILLHTRWFQALILLPSYPLVLGRRFSIIWRFTLLFLSALQPYCSNIRPVRFQDVPCWQVLNISRARFCAKGNGVTPLSAPPVGFWPWLLALLVLVLYEQLWTTTHPKRANFPLRFLFHFHCRLLASSLITHN